MRNFPSYNYLIERKNPTNITFGYGRDDTPVRGEGEENREKG